MLNSIGVSRLICSTGTLKGALNRLNSGSLLLGLDVLVEEKLLLRVNLLLVVLLLLVSVHGRVLAQHSSMRGRLEGAGGVAHLSNFLNVGLLVLLHMWMMVVAWRRGLRLEAIVLHLGLAHSSRGRRHH